MTTQSTILETTDYDMFKTIVGNRNIFQPHLRRLIASIEAKNMLAQNPIIVNEAMEVIDGQHRLLAAKALGLPIYYSVVSQASLTEIQMLNANSRPWLTADYLHSYVTMGKKDYIRLKEFAEEYRISISIALTILSPKAVVGRELKKFRSGDFVIEDYDKGESVASLVSEVRRHSPDGSFAHKFCVRALVILLDKVDPKLFTEKLEKYQSIITRRQSIKDYLRQFENIINAGQEGREIRLV